MQRRSRDGPRKQCPLSLKLAAPPFHSPFHSLRFIPLSFFTNQVFRKLCRLGSAKSHSKSYSGHFQDCEVSMRVASASTKGFIKWNSQATLAAFLLSGVLMGCCFSGSRDITSDPKASYNFTPLLKGKCFQTKIESLFSPGFYLQPLGPGTGVKPNLSHLEPGDALLPAGTRFRVVRMVEDCGDSGGTHVEATILNGALSGRTVDVKLLFLPKSVTSPGESGSGFIIGPYVAACDDRP